MNLGRHTAWLVILVFVLTVGCGEVTVRTPDLPKTAEKLGEAGERTAGAIDPLAIGQLNREANEKDAEIKRLEQRVRDLEVGSTGTTSPKTTLDAKLLIVRAELHLQDRGDVAFVSPDPATMQPKWLGTREQSRRLEGFYLTVDGIPNEEIRYKAYIADTDWTDWVYGGDKIEKRTGKAIQSICIQLTGDAANKYDVVYRAHVKREGETEWCLNGEPCGTIGKGLQMEAFQVMVRPK